MPRFKPDEQDQIMILPINFKEQIGEGTFEYVLNDIINNHVDLSILTIIIRMIKKEQRHIFLQFYLKQFYMDIQKAYYPQGK